MYDRADVNTYPIVVRHTFPSTNEPFADQIIVLRLGIPIFIQRVADVLVTFQDERSQTRS